MTDLVACNRAPNLLRGIDVVIPDDVSLGANVILYPGTHLGRGCHIEHGAIIGRSSRIGVGSVARPTVNGPTVLGDRTIVGSYAIICAGVVAGEDAFIGERAFIRERVRLGAQVCIGFSTTVGPDCIIRDRTRIQGFGALRHTVIEPDCVIGPYVGILTSSLRGEEGQSPDPVVIRRGSRIGSAVQIMPGLSIGPYATIAVSSVVTRDVAPRMLVGGNPARAIRIVPSSDE